MMSCINQRVVGLLAVVEEIELPAQQLEQAVEVHVLRMPGGDRVHVGGRLAHGVTPLWMAHCFPDQGAGF
jgi:hypothetical protein